MSEPVPAGADDGYRELYEAMCRDTERNIAEIERLSRENAEQSDVMLVMLTKIEQLGKENAKLREALNKIANHKKAPVAVSLQEVNQYIDGWDICIDIARAALGGTDEPPV